jgi:hypothetical protein
MERMLVEIVRRVAMMSREKGTVHSVHGHCATSDEPFAGGDRADCPPFPK